MKSLTNLIMPFFSYPHEFCHYIVARMLRLEIRQVCFYKKVTLIDKTVGFVDIKYPDIITRNFMLKLGLTAIAPIILTIIMLIPLFLVNYNDLKITNYVMFAIYLFYFSSFCKLGFAPTIKDTHLFLNCIGSAFKGTIIVTDENGQSIIENIY